ncbi:hypothetical protein MNEG_15583 [Monoraphidium neglectum]|uniref:Protein kinase domain-containing protein n=1 Tax=Monoraphidium neglectum TaxID=145388 RepID=A0A0D2MAK0_9CHLO|nr:hypothetical protein MNEG_15583 [Monoraphidium neglectum]KIY92380.1 hypothetical protein MNEG_15583 [Monoraphidium neglectum]|eukprot:XP_013891400.1 hypothetical protein MNEG_15583 [Monoraphidium neglectum]
MGTCVSVPVVGGVGRPSAGRVAVRVDLPALKPCEANGAGQAAHQWPQSRPLGKALAQLRTFKASGSQRFRLAALLNGAPPADGACDAAAVAGAEPREPTPATRPGGASALRLALFSPRLHDSAQSVSGKPRGGGGAARRRRPLGARLRGRDAAAADPFAATAAADGGPPQRVALRDLVTGEIIPDFGVDGVFDVLQLLGSGGAGCTYLCRDLATKDLVAVKFMQRPLPKLAVPLLLRGARHGRPAGSRKPGWRPPPC